MIITRANDVLDITRIKNTQWWRLEEGGYVWKGPDRFHTKFTGELPWKMLVLDDELGNYRVRLEHKQPGGVASDAANDCWFSARAPQSNTWSTLKTFVSGSQGSFTSDTSFEFSEGVFGTDPGIVIDRPGLWMFSISGRSVDYQIRRVHIELNPDDTREPQVTEAGIKWL